MRFTGPDVNGTRARSTCRYSLFSRCPGLRRVGRAAKAPDQNVPSVASEFADEVVRLQPSLPVG